MLRLITLLMTSFLLLAAAGCGGSSDAPTVVTSSAPYSQTDLVAGFGVEATSGRTVTVNYAGWLYDTSRPEGKGSQFDARSNFPFTLGRGEVIAGWDRGVLGMKIGGQRRLIIPPELAYGAPGRGPIPPNATLIFDITLTGVQ
jgi:FKBP-type peptidyl-prolyl cis-trans isomerase FkpA